MAIRIIKLILLNKLVNTKLLSKKNKW